MKTIISCTLLTSVLVTFSIPALGALGDGLVSYWPLDTVEGEITPDVVNGYHMTLVNLTDSDLVAGRTGQAFAFEAGNQTLLERLHQEGDLLPVNDRFESWSISLWVKGKGTGQNDLRVFSEASTSDNAPLFNIGTANNGSSDAVDIYIRGQNGTINHPHSTAEPFDDTWHQITWYRPGCGGLTEFEGRNELKA